MLPDSHAVVASTKNLHAWEAGGADSAEALSAWVSARLKAHDAALAMLLAVEGERTLENSLRLYDEAIEQLSLAGAQAGILNSVAADKAVRDQAQLEAQRVAQAASALSLNRAVYEALAAVDLGGANTPISAATKHYVERTLLRYRLAGVDKNQATRDHLRSFIVQALQVVARGLVLVHAGQPVAEQRPLDIVLCRRADGSIGPAQINRRKSLIDSSIQAQGAGGLRHPLRFQLRLVAHRLVGSYGVQNARLRASQAELLDGLVVEAQRVLQRALAFDRQQHSQRRIMRLQARATQAESASAESAPPTSQA